MSHHMAPHTVRELLWLAAWRRLAAQTVRPWRGRRLGALHFWAALPVLALTYWGVVIQAATDNLTELVAAPQPLAFVALCAWFDILFLAAALLASPAQSAQRVTRLAGVVVSLPLAVLFLHLGLRYSMLHSLVIAALAFLQWPYFRFARQHYAHRPHASH